MGELRSQKQQREQLVRSLRTLGASWVEVAAVLRERYHINARVAFRYAHCWSQQRAADEWNQRWPDELKTFKNFSYWESWPGSTGHAPSFDNLGRLAELYECAVGDLLVDFPDFRHLDLAVSGRSGAGKKLVTLSDECRLDGDEGVSAQDYWDQWDLWSPFVLAPEAAPLVQRLQKVDFTELARVIVMWMHRLDPSASRRALLFKLSAAFTAAAASPLFDMLNPAEYEPAVRFVDHPDKFNLPTLTYVERTITNLRQQGDLLGPQLTLHSVIGHRQVVWQLAKVAPENFRQRAVSAYAELTQLLGWLCFNMGNYHGAQHYYDDARSAAHDAQNIELVSYILCTMSHLATWQGKPRVGIDHAVAAAVWADQAHSPLARAYAADVTARAYVADDQQDKYRENLDREYAVLQSVRTDEPAASWWDYYNESFYWGTEGECAIKTQRPELAMKALDKSLKLVGQADVHNYSFCLSWRAEARIQQAEISEASGIIGDVARLAAGSGSQRLAERITDLRALLVPWEKTKSVRELDERLAVYRPAMGSGSGSTKSTYSL